MGRINVRKGREKCETQKEKEERQDKVEVIYEYTIKRKCIINCKLKIRTRVQKG
jgi:hypothetical protein